MNWVKNIGIASLGILALLILGTGGGVGSEVSAQVGSSSTSSITVLKTGPGASMGYVQGVSLAIFCGSDCTEVFVPTSTVAKYLIASSGSSTFDSWTGCDVASGTTCQVLFTTSTPRHVNITANFNLLTSTSTTPTSTPPANVGPTLRAVTSKVDSLEKNVPLVLGHSFPTGHNNYVMLAVVNTRAHEDVASVAYLTSSSSSQSFIKAIERDCGGDQQQKVSVWYLKNPIGSAGTVAINYSTGAVNSEGAIVMTYSGVDQVAPIGFVSGGCGNTGTAMRVSAVATTPHSVLVGVVNKRRAIQDGVLSTITIPPGYTERFNGCSGSGIYDDCYSVADKAAAFAAENLTFTTNNSNNWATVAVELKPPAGFAQIETSDLPLLANILEALRLVIDDLQKLIQGS